MAWSLPNWHAAVDSPKDGIDGCWLTCRFMGIVEDVGPAVKDIKKGDRVVAAFDLGCGSCFYCKKDLYSSCDT